MDEAGRAKELKKCLVFHIVNFLTKEVSNGEHSFDVAESLEVAKQCLETSFEFNLDDINVDTQPDLPTIYQAGLAKLNCAISLESFFPPSDEAKVQAERLKVQGNQCMAENMFQEAVECYTKAIELVKDKAVYYCNRAAAYSRLQNNERAVQDCQLAVKIDPQYSKAFGRMGLAYSGMGDYSRAVECYKRALEIDPVNQSYQQNLSIAESRVQGGNPNNDSQSPTLDQPASGTRPTTAPPPRMPNMGGMDFSAMLNNPAMMNMVSQMMGNPQMQQMMTNLVSGFSGQSNTTTTTTTGSPAPTPPVHDILRMGQQLAQEMQSNNPDLIENLARQMHGNENPNSENDQSQNGDQPDNHGNGS